MQPNWQNRTMWTGDNPDIMRGMNSESVDLIYLDPPFNSNRNDAAPIGSQAAGAAFKDTWTLSDVDEAWHGKGMKSYLIMMAMRLLEMRRLLKPTGSLYLHCDPTASHYLKTLMDAVFGKEGSQHHDSNSPDHRRLGFRWRRRHSGRSEDLCGPRCVRHQCHHGHYGAEYLRR